MNRRHMIAALASTALAGAQTPTAGRTARKGRIKQACFMRNLTSAAGPQMSPDEMFQFAARLGVAGFDFVPPQSSRYLAG